MGEKNKNSRQCIIEDRPGSVSLVLISKKPRAGGKAAARYWRCSLRKLLLYSKACLKSESSNEDFFWSSQLAQTSYGSKGLDSHHCNTRLEEVIFFFFFT